MIYKITVTWRKIEKQQKLFSQTAMNAKYINQYTGTNQIQMTCSVNENVENPAEIK